MSFAPPPLGDAAADMLSVTPRAPPGAAAPAAALPPRAAARVALLSSLGCENCCRTRPVGRQMSA